MTKFIRVVVLAIVMCGLVGDLIIKPNIVMADDNDKILKAKEIVRAMFNDQKTLVFHVCYTKVNGNIVTLKFTAKNAFGVLETFDKDIKVD